MGIDILAVIACVAVNAIPSLSASLVEGMDRNEVRKVLEARGGERFGERDNSRELEVLQTWLAQRPMYKDLAQQPSMHAVVRSLLDPKEHGWTMELMEIDDGSQIEAMMRHKLSVLEMEPPSVLFVRCRVAAATLAKLAVVDLGRQGPSQGQSQERSQERDKALKDHTRATALARTVGIDDQTTGPMVMQSIQQLQQWLDHAPPECHSTRDAVRTALGLDIWSTLVDRLDKQLTRTAERRRRAEREPRYVLRAMLVQSDKPLDTTSNNVLQYSGPINNALQDTGPKLSVIRHFGHDSGHTSELNTRGVCQPIRIQDIRGTSIESIWVCCSDDAECGTLVVADPDDEIFCTVCGDSESLGYDQIVLCDGCESAVHQMCHKPVVTETELVDDRWFCSACRPSTKRVRTK
ncbi:hypothetical protein GGH12_000571 [Coemansia sp. RSA 1822]|nr:hypothetical protein GGH12_000571 [Coemansia sp. RSA 1822]